MAINNQQQSPYVGPQPFERRHIDIFYGRDKETSELLSFVSTHQLVLFYAQSGIGKTSLLNAGLIPQLEQEEFEIFPVARVRGLIPEHIPYERVTNPYVFNTLISWVPQDTDPATLLNLSLNDFLRERPHLQDRTGFELPRVAIFDQFEELFSFYPDKWKQREDFFRQLAEALAQDDLFRVIFVMREDFIAQIDPYTHLLPDRLRSRFRLEPMSPQAALPAVIQPLKNTQRSFAPGVAEQLVQELTKVRVEIQEGKTQTITGESVEPVQLQVVCQNLWQHLPPDVKVINHQHLEAFGDVDEALSQFYEDSLALAVAETGVTETQLRDWFQHVLITPAGTRGTVYQDANETGGIPNSAVRVLENQHIVRAEMRAGGRWYELNHDRFVEPILNSNAAWGIKHSEAESQARESALRQRVQRQVAFIGVLSLILVGVIGLTIFAFQQRMIAENNAGTATVAQGEAIIQANNAATQAANATIAQGESIIQANNAATEAANATIAQGEAIIQANNAATEAANATIAQGEAIIQANNAATQAANATMAQGEAIVQANNAQTQAANATIAQGESIIQANNAQTQAANATIAQGEAIVQANNAATEAANAENSALFAQSMSLSNTSLQVLANENPELAIALALEANQFATPAPLAYQALFDAVTFSFVQRRFSGHLEAVNAVDISPDDRLIASGSNDSTVIIWNAASGAILHTLTGHESDVLAVKFSPDGEVVVSGDVDGVVIIWNVETGEIVNQFSAHIYPVTGIDFSPDGNYFLTSTWSAITQWETATGEENDTVELNSSLTIDALQYGIRENTVLIGGTSGAAEGFVRLLDFTGINDQTLFEAETASPVVSLDMDATGTRIVTGENNGDLKLWNAQDETYVGFRQYAQTVYAVLFSPDGRYIFSGSWGTSPLLWDASTLTVVRMLSGESTGIYAADFSTDGDFAVSGSDDSTLIQWDVQTSEQIAIYSGHTGWVGALAYHPSGNSFVSGSYDSRIIWWDTTTHQSMMEFHGHSSAVYSAVFSPDGTQLLSGGTAGEVFLWDTSRAVIKNHFDAGEENILSVDISADGRYAAAGSDVIRIWDIETGERVAVSGANHHTDVVWSVKFSPDGRYLVSASGDSSVVVWDWQENRIVHRLLGHQGRINTVSVSPDGRLIATGASDDLIILWDMQSGERLQTLRGHRNFINAVNFSPDGQTLLSGSDDGTVIWWDVATGLPLRRYIGHNNWVLGVAFSPDGTRAASASADGNVIEWLLVPYPQGLFVWSEANRAIAELTCEDRELLEVQNRCVEGTPVPTRTPFPTLVPTMTLTPSPTLDLTRVTATPSPTNTATPSPEPQIGSVFDAADIPLSSGYQVVSRDNVTIDLTGEDNLFSFEFVGGTYEDFAIGATITWGPGAEEDECGFIFRQAESQSYYILEIDQLGHVDFSPKFDAEWQDNERVDNDVTVAGKGNSNQVVLIAVGDQFRVYINNEEVAQFTDATLSAGELGLLGGTNDESNQTFCIFNDIWVWDFAYEQPQLALPTSVPTRVPTRVPPTVATDAANPQIAELFEELDIPLSSGYQALSEDRLRIDLTDDDDLLRFETYDQHFEDFAMGVTFTWGPGAEEDECGFIFRRSDDGSNYYVLELDQLANIDFTPLLDDRWLNTVSEESTVTVNGEGNSNYLVLFGIGDEFTVFLNNQQVARFTDDRLTEGEVGMLAGTSDESDETYCTFNDFWVWDFAFEQPELAEPTPLASATPSDTVETALAAMDIGVKSGYQVTLEDELVLDIEGEEGVTVVQTLDGIYGDFAMGATVEWGAGSEINECGFVFRLDETSYYTVRINREANMRVRPLFGEAYETLLETTVNNLNVGANDSNELWVVALGDEFLIYINGEYAAEFTDAELAEGEVGVFGVGYDKVVDTRCIFTDLWLWEFTSRPQVVVQTPLPPRTPEPSLPTGVVINLAIAGIQPDDGTLAGELDTVEFDAENSFAYFDGEYTNFVVHGNIEMSDQVGCGFSLRDSLDGTYLLMVDDAGFVSLIDLQDEDVVLIDGSASSVVNLRRADEFELMVVVEDESFRIFINDEEVLELEADIYAQGRVAALSVTDSDEGCIFTDSWLFELP